MISELERRLSQFVNREDEMLRFCHMLDTGEKPIMLVWGDSGIGKSSLLARMIHEAAKRKLRKSEIVWTPTRNHDYLAVMRKIRDDVGVEYFNRFTDLVNFFTVQHYELKVAVETSGPIEVAAGAKISQSRVENIAGVIIQDLHLTIPRDDKAVPEEERMARLTDQFISDLETALQDGPLIVFFDATEKMAKETQAWVWNELFGAMRDGRLTNIRFVLCGQKKPEESEEWPWMVEEAKLGPLDRAYIIEYLSKRGVDEASRDDLADMLLVTTRGYADSIAKYVEAFLAMQKKRSGD